jgi:hypothetical protein
MPWFALVSSRDSLTRETLTPLWRARGRTTSQESRSGWWVTARAKAASCDGSRPSRSTRQTVRSGRLVRTNGF